MILSEGGFLNAGKRLELTSRADGTLDRKFFDTGREKPYEPGGKAWLAEILPNIIRRSGLGAEARVERILKAKGADGVLTEILDIRPGHVKRQYFSAFFDRVQPAEPAFAQAITEAEFLTSFAQLKPEGALRDQYLEAAARISSEYERDRARGAAPRLNRLQ